MEALAQEARAPLAARMLGIAAVLVAAGVLVVWGIDLGRRVLGVSRGESGPTVAQHLASAELELARVTAERDELAERLKQVPPPAPPAPAPAAADAAELARLNADLALLESVLPPAKAGSGLVIRGMQARMAGPRQLHYTVLLAYGARKKGPAAFAGRLQLSVSVRKDGMTTLLSYPQAGAERYDIQVAHYQRVDGTLELPEGVQAQAVKVSMVEKGKVIASETRAVR